VEEAGHPNFNWYRGTVTATTMTASRGAGPQTGRHATLFSAYFWLLLFITLYFLRPEDWIPGLAVIPIEKVTGFLALMGFGFGMLAAGQQFLRMPRETFYLILLFGQFCLTIPFAIWRGGAFRVVFFVIAKVVLIAVATSLVVNTWPQLRRLVFVQACAAPVLAAAALVRHRLDKEGRLMGVGNNFANANDFAFLMALTFPLCIALMLSTRNPLAKAAWVLGMVIMGVALTLTGSRMAVLTMAVSMGVCLWQFGLKGRRPYLVFLAALVALGVAGLAGRRLIERLASTFTARDISAYESTELRKETLKKSLLIAAQHPLFGVGPGNFQVVSGVWREAHNSFTEVAAEAGFPALILFLMILRRGFVNLREVKRLSDGQTEKVVLAGALQASLATFMVGGLFSTWEYQYVPYLLVAYSTAFYQIAAAEPPPELKATWRPRQR
jgi:O-antigen ligase